MKMYLPFGDYSGDGHKQYEKVLIDAPSMEHLLNAQEKIKNKYGENFFEGFATECEESTLTGENMECISRRRLSDRKIN